MLRKVFHYFYILRQFVAFSRKKMSSLSHPLHDVKTSWNKMNGISSFKASGFELQNELRFVSLILFYEIITI